METNQADNIPATSPGSSSANITSCQQHDGDTGPTASTSNVLPAETSSITRVGGESSDVNGVAENATSAMDGVGSNHAPSAEMQKRTSRKRKWCSSSTNSGERSPLPGSPLTSESEDEFDIEGHDVSQIENDVLTGMLGDGSRPSMNIDLFCEGKPRRKIKDAVSDEPGPFEYTSTLHEYEDDGRVTAKTRRGRSESPENIDQVDDEPSRPDLSDSDRPSYLLDLLKQVTKMLMSLGQEGDETVLCVELVNTCAEEERENEDDVAAKPMQDKDGTTIAPQLKQDEDDVTIVPTEPSMPKKKGKMKRPGPKSSKVISSCDDSNDAIFLERLRQLDELDEPEPKQFKEIGDKLKVSRTVWDRLFKYQKEGVVWLSELHEEYVGGILADEMGLGKTVQ
ncbi:hypothetical protein COOONC_19111, partial [Cooperia oncophora]